MCCIAYNECWTRLANCWHSRDPSHSALAALSRAAACLSKCIPTHFYTHCLSLAIVDPQFSTPYLITLQLHTLSSTPHIIMQIHVSFYSATSIYYWNTAKLCDKRTICRYIISSDLYFGMTDKWYLVVKINNDNKLWSNFMPTHDSTAISTYIQIRFVFNLKPVIKPVQL